MKNLILTAGILFAVCALSGVEIANPKQAGAWNLSFPGKRHQTFRVEQYSQKEGAAAEIKAEPHIFKYSELQLEQPVVIAERPEDFRGELVLKFRPDTPETFAAVSAEFVDRSGEVFRFRKALRPRPGAMETVRIPAGDRVRPFRVLGGNLNREIDYPVSFKGLRFDYNPSEKPIRLTVEDVQWKAEKQ